MLTNPYAQHDHSKLTKAAKAAKAAEAAEAAEAVAANKTVFISITYPLSQNTGPRFRVGCSKVNGTRSVKTEDPKGDDKAIQDKAKRIRLQQSILVYGLS